MSVNQSFDEFLDIVGKMRSAQKEYFSTKNWNALTQAKHYEKAVDEFLKTAAVKQKDTGQQDLF